MWVRGRHSHWVTPQSKGSKCEHTHNREDGQKSGSQAVLRKNAPLKRKCPQSAPPPQKKISLLRNRHPLYGCQTFTSLVFISLLPSNYRTYKFCNKTKLHKSFFCWLAAPRGAWWTGLAAVDWETAAWLTVDVDHQTGCTFLNRLWILK